MTSVPRPAADELIDVSVDRGPLRRMADLWAHRELIRNLIRRELRVRYKGSVLGFVWSLLSPALYLVVFSIVFMELLRVQIPRFGLFLLTGLLVWNFVSGSLGGAVSSLVSNRSLVQKVWFPREVLPLAAVGASLINLVLQASVLVLGLLAFRNVPEVRHLPVLAVALVVLVVFTTGLSLVVSALNVRYRDVQHLLDVALLAWFWLSAVVYPYAVVAERLGDAEWATTANPMLPIILTFQRVLYNPPEDLVLPASGAGWYLTRLGVVAAISVLTCIAGLHLFRRLEDDFGEQL